jgi:hypothetical protein
VFLGDASKLKKELDGVDASAAQAESGFSKVGKAIAGVAVASSVVSFGKGAFDAAIESQKIAAQTEAVIKSMGLSSTVTAGQIGDLAGSLSKKNGVDDEAIQTGQNLLLTFGDLAKTAGQSGGAFERASQVMVDMGAAMGTDASASAIQLGKALNDPTAGLSALSRVGVSFTDQQKEQIKAMQESGDMAGAQGVLLAELEKQFGGSAAAQATATDRMKIAFGNLQEEIGAKLVPAVEAVSAWMVNTGLPAFERFIGFISENWPQVQAVIEQVMERVRVVIQNVLAGIEAFWRTWGGTITAYLDGLWNALRQIIEGAMNIIKGVIDVVMGLIHGDWSRVWDGIKSILEGAWQVLNGIVDYAINEIRTRIEIVMRLIAGVFSGAWDGIKGLFSSAFAAITMIVWEAWDGIVGFFEKLPQRILSAFAALWDKVKELAADAAGAVKKQLDAMLGPIDEIIGKLGGLAGKTAGVFSGGGDNSGVAPTGVFKSQQPKTQVTVPLVVNGSELGQAIIDVNGAYN